MSRKMMSTSRKETPYHHHFESMDSLMHRKRQFCHHPFFRWVIVAAIFLFLGKMVWSNWNQVREASFTLEVFPLILSTLIYAFSYFIQIWAWYLITLRLNISLSPSETVESWFYSQFGKYLPGKIWLLLSRFYFYESKGRSKKNISVALYLEIVTMIAAAAVIFLAVLILYRDMGFFSFWGRYGWFFLLFLLAFVFLHPRVLQKMLNWVLVRWKRDPISLSISYAYILWILFVCILSWIVGGIGFYLFVDSVYPVASPYIFYLTGALAASSMLGLVAIFAPSGLGVREGALVYLLSFLMASPIAVILSVLTRLWMTLIEIGLIGVIYLFRKFQRPADAKPHGEKEEKPKNG